MSLFPFATTEEVNLSTTEVIASEVKEYGVDFKTGKLTGKIVEGLDAVCVWAYLALKTKRYRWVIFSWNHGEEYTDLIGYSHSEAYLKSEVKRCVEECLFENEHIKAIEDLEVSQEKELLKIRFRMVTDFGSKEVDWNV